MIAMDRPDIVERALAEANASSTAGRVAMNVAMSPFYFLGWLVGEASWYFKMIWYSIKAGYRQGSAPKFTSQG
jgi:hypothetical protein